MEIERKDWVWCIGFYDGRDIHLFRETNECIEVLTFKTQEGASEYLEECLDEMEYYRFVIKIEKKHIDFYEAICKDTSNL